MIVVTFTVCGVRPHALQEDKLPLPLGADSSENHKDHRLQPRCAFTLTSLKSRLFTFFCILRSVKRYTLLAEFHLLLTFFFS